MNQDFYGRCREDLGQGLYVISAGEDGPCKIGITNDLTARLRQLQVGNWVSLRPRLFTFVIGKNIRRGLNMWSAFSNGSEGLERAVHIKLRELDTHLSGEWFDVGENDCVAALKKVADIEGFRLAGPEILQSISNYEFLPVRQLAYVNAMIAAESSAQSAFFAAGGERLD